MKSKLLICLLICATNIFGQSVAQPMTFFIDDRPVYAGTPTKKTLCGVQTGSGSGGMVSVPHNSYFIFRFGPGFGTITGYDNLRVTSRNGGDPLGTVTADDFEVEMQSAPGKILIEYSNAETHQLGYLDQICVDVYWTPPGSPTQGIVDFNVTIDPTKPTTAVLQIAVQSSSSASR